MTLIRFVLLTAVLIAVALGAPSDEKTEKDKSETTAVAEKKTDVVDRGITATDQSWDAIFSPATWNILGGAFGSVLLLSGVGVALYYFYYLQHFAATEYHTGTGGVFNQAYPYTTPTGTAAGYQNYYAPSARSLDTGRGWSWPQVLYMITLAQESYEKFDFQTLDCQKKALCELSHKQNDFGATGRKLTDTFSYLDVVEGLPMPTIIQTFLKEYREAINQGRNSNKDCGIIYPKCNFSLKDVIVKYQKKAAAEKF